MTNVQPWEERRKAARVTAARDELLEQGKLFVFDGGSDERTRAVSVITEIIRRHREGPLKIWDVYFSGDDLLSVFQGLSDSSLPIRILSNEKKRPTNDALTNARPPSLDEATDALGNEGMKAGVSVDVEHRRGESFHDRFLITDSTCWQLGSSFNHIGSRFTTILEFPHPDLVIRAFDQAWKAAGS
ncbi:MAG: VPA1262 family N-terminal domain-containing protein [Planctomycetota bacterium]